MPSNWRQSRGDRPFERGLAPGAGLARVGKTRSAGVDLHLSLGPPLTATRGWAASELEMNYRQAEELCQKMGDDAHCVPALWLLAVYRLGARNTQLWTSSLNGSPPWRRKLGIQGCCVWPTCKSAHCTRADLTEARQSLTHASLPPRCRSAAFPGLPIWDVSSVLGLAYLSNCLWLLGFPEQATQRSQEACDLAVQDRCPDDHLLRSVQKMLAACVCRRN